MALVYSALGIAAGLAGEGLAAWLQTPWVLALFALALVALSLSMFGFYELQLPAALRGALAQSSQRLRGGRLAGVFAMGGLSALIVSPCVAAPLAGALVYLSQTRDVALGGSALFALAAGMSVPLLLLGASAGALLPKAGAWMDDVKRLFGLLLLGVAIWIVQPVLPASLSLALWGALLIGAAAWLGLPVRGAPAWRRALGLVAAVAGALQLIGAASGGTDPIQPLSHLGSRNASARHLRFEPVRSIAELDATLAGAGRPVMLDFYADWCVSCKEMERFTFSDPRVRDRLAGALLLKADVTKNSADDRALMRRFGLFGPPGTLFFDASGRERSDVRVIGYQDAGRFLQTLSAAGL
jgi:thiol:disulfide interchange protein DsbD